MTKVATVGELSVHNALHFGSGPAGSKESMVTTKNLKRKTPSELRGEWLRRRLSVETMDDSPSLTGDMKSKTCDSSKAPRFTRMDDHYPVTKISRLLSRKEDTLKETVSKDLGNCQLRSSAPLGIVSEKQELKLRPEQTVTSESGNASNLGNSSTQNFNIGTFKTVRELSLRDEKSDCSLFFDMGTALKGLVSHEPLAPAPFQETADISGNSSRAFFTEASASTKGIPLDFSLKSKMHLLSSSSVSWFHRLINSASRNHTTLFLNGDCQPNAKSELLSPGALHSWVHPQVCLPREAISALASSSGDFLDKRHQAWEDSFRGLYYMLRKRICRIFYVCSSQFVVMFTLSDGPNQTKYSCCAYISQSTRNLRSLLKQHDVLFSMPLCCSKMEEGTAEDLVELSEIERHNLGQTRVPDAIPGVDNTPQSLLMFTGEKNVHALYDFILNYRFLLTTLTGGDVPVLYSPIPFENAALSAPEVKCKQVRKVGYISSQQKDSTSVFETGSASASGICYSVEIKDAFLPPWVICAICDTMRANGADFQASFVTDPMSIGLNFAIDNAASNDCSKEDESQHFGILNTSLSLRKRRAYLKGLEYSDGSYTATISPIE